MNRLSAIGFAFLAFAIVSHAGEVTVEKRPFTIDLSFTASVLPASGCVLVQSEPKSWTHFQIAELTAHGTKVEKGDLLVRFDATEIDQKLAETRAAVAISTFKIAQTEGKIPASDELMKLEVEELKILAQREKDTLAELEHDRKLIEIKAPTEGIFYHGPIENGRWSNDPDPLKNLVVHGKPPIHRPFATLVPSTAKLVFIAFPDESSARSLKPELTGTATFAGREDAEIPVILTKLATTPSSDGLYRAEFAATWPKDWTTVIGSTARIHVTAYQNKDAIVIPTKALVHSANAWTVEVKLADGKTEPRPVKRGRVSGENSEILSGLEIGQVVISP